MEKFKFLSIFVIALFVMSVGSVSFAQEGRPTKQELESMTAGAASEAMFR